MFYTRRMKHLKATLLLLVLAAAVAGAQEALKSVEEEYYDFLALCGIVARPTLNYRTLSDSEWQIPDGAEHPWQGNNLGAKRVLWQSKNDSEGNFFTRGIEQSVALKIYGPEWYNSYNTSSPYGQNDGALWQGKGYNTSLTGGARLEAYGFELTFKPQVSFSQNKDFDYIQPNYSSGKAATYGYYGLASVDAPQRFGDSSFWTFDWGDSEVRYSWHTLTVGFGTQAIWLGPARLNPILHSNNAASYPKVDIGLRKTQMHMPHFGWYLGKIEVRGWWGMLTESDYFDDDDSNDNNLIAGFALAWNLPGILDGLTIGVNRTMLSKWNDKDAYTMLEIYGFSNFSSGEDDESDQRVSLTFDYVLPEVGFELYLEWARNDYSPEFNYYLRYPFHTEAWTLGGRKAFNLSPSLKMEILAEVTFLHASDDYYEVISWDTTFYAHDKITQGYTNRGQWLGAGIGTGGDSQYLGVKFYYPKGSTNVFVQRVNPDLDYTFFMDLDSPSVETNIRVQISGGIEQEYFVSKSLRLKGAFVYIYELNPLNDKPAEGARNNFNFQFAAKYNF